MFNVQHARRLHGAAPRQLLYKRAAKLKKAESVETVSPKIQPHLPPDVPERYAKYYARCPPLLQPHLREMLTHPAGFVLSIAALQQAATLLPFLVIWYTLFKTGGGGDLVEATLLPDTLLERGTALMETAVAKSPVADELVPEQRLAAVRAGATAYALVSTASPLVWATSVALAPALRRSCERSLTRLRNRFL